ncbi:MAG: cbb3-type cytochrome c oxidase subunit I [Acidimicrobiia bacterium]
MTAVIPNPSDTRKGPKQSPAARPAWRVDIAGVDAADLFPVKWQLYLALAGLGIGVAQGLIQALERVNVRLYEQLPLSQSYYQGLTLHGVALAFVFTFCFANALMPLMAMKGYQRPMISRTVANASLWCAWGGTALATWAILANDATVLFTFYSPLKAQPAFYIGAVLLVVSTWLTFANVAFTTKAWKRDHPGERTPLPSYMSMITGLMWSLASLGVAIEVVGFLLPWSFGLTDKVDPQFNRILFWFTGHPIVYFWLLPAYMCWYLVLPEVSGKGKLYSDGLARLSFLGFLLLLPVGVHHQFTDPGVPISSKGIMWLLTWVLFMPSLVTMFSVLSALENAGRNRGGKGLLGWIWKLPWGNPVVSGQLLAGIAFMLGGASGLINSSYTINLVVHNTSFIVGHFHLTVGTAVALTIMAVSYSLVPYLTGKALWGRRIAVAQTWTWFIGVAVFSRGQMMGGLESMPRRTQISKAVYLDQNGWTLANRLTAVGGTIMFIGGVLFFVVLFGTLMSKRHVTEPQEIPIVTAIHGPRDTWAALDQFVIWAAIAMLLVVLVYGEVIAHYWPLNLVSKGIKVW